MYQKILLALFLCSALLMHMAACSPVAKHEMPRQDITPFLPGKVISRVTCTGDSTLSYALYLPKNYDPAQHYPLIIAFDAHAAGKLVVDLFCTEAERFGYIVAGSNNSKNGIAWDITSAQYDVMRQDILQRLTIDTKRIYTAGFSGGSRVASSVAISKGGITGVIGCSAGFPQTGKPITTRFSYLGIVGNADFNYTEMKALDKALDEAGFVHHLLVFDGIHAWPPASLIPSVFTWLELDAMRQKLKPADEKYISLIKLRYQKETDSLHRANDIVAEYEKCLEAVHYLKGVADVSSFAASEKQLGNTAIIKKQREANDRIAQKEIQLQQYYVQAMGAQGEKWWNEEVKQLNDFTGSIHAKAEHTMYKRVLSYLSLAAYMQASGALKGSDQEMAGHFIRLYALIDPTNPEAPYLNAVLLAAQGKDDVVLQNLNKAADLGFNDLKRIESDPVFTRFKGKQDFETIIGRMRGK